MAECLDFVSFWLGLLVGFMALLIIFTALYNARVFAFEHCSTGGNVCLGSEYYNDPGNAIANGATATDILSLNEENEMLYKRVPKDSCTPGTNQTVNIINPQYCLFKDDESDSSGVTGRSIQFGSNIYQLEGSHSKVKTDGNCIPKKSSCFDTGIPLIEWDPNPLDDE